MVGIGLVVGLGLVQSLYRAHRAVVPAIAWRLVLGWRSRMRSDNIGRASAAH